MAEFPEDLSDINRDLVDADYILVNKLKAALSRVLTYAKAGFFASAEHGAALTDLDHLVGYDESASNGQRKILMTRIYDYLLAKVPIVAAKYTPTPVNVANVASFSTTYEHIYFRLGDFVVVGGAQRYTPTGAGTSQFGIPLPIASNLAAADGRGLVSSGNSAFTRGNTAADDANNRVDVFAVVSAGSIHDVAYAFWYEVKA
jgi:hypothetical protein